ncbi:MAG: calcium-binding protein [Limnospira sp.]
MANIDGDNGNNFLWGTNSADFMRGLAGNDRIYARNGNDTAYGGVGSDTISGGNGNDKIYGDKTGNPLIPDLPIGSRLASASASTSRQLFNTATTNSTFQGDDFIDGQGGRDELSGGLGNDTIKGGGGHDRMFGDRGDDMMDGDGGNDEMFGGEGLDSIFGDTGNDTIDGGGDADLVEGGNGNDWVLGGSGDNTVVGGFGEDTVVSGSGDDILIGGGSFLDGDSPAPNQDNQPDIYRITGDSSSGFGNDELLGFEVGLDRIEFEFDILLNVGFGKLPNDQWLKNFEVLDFYPNGLEAGSDDGLTDLDFPFVEAVNGGLLIHLPASGEVALEGGDNPQTGTLEYQVNGNVFNFGGGTLLIEGVGSLTEDDFIFAS